MRRKISIQTGKKLLGYIWPDFQEIKGLILISSEIPKQWKSFEGWSQIGIEAFCNHIHMIDLFDHHAELALYTEEDKSPFDFEHPDFQQLCEAGKQIAQIWFLKLQQDFPQYRFRVYYTQYDNPVVRFHKVREAEPVWLTDGDNAKAIQNSEIIIWDTENQS